MISNKNNYDSYSWTKEMNEKEKAFKKKYFSKDNVHQYKHSIDEERTIQHFSRSSYDQNCFTKSQQIRIPSKKRSKRVWKDFYKLFKGIEGKEYYNKYFIIADIQERLHSTHRKIFFKKIK
jgi:hypothetical protein